MKTMLTPTGDFVCFAHQKVVLLSFHQVNSILTDNNALSVYVD